jgi:hypothetical protein
MGKSGYWSSIDSVIQVVKGSSYNVAKAVDAIKFFMSSGNLTSGTIKVYGVL